MATGNHVIFLHPDGTSPSHYAFARFVDKGPDGRLNWDNLDHAGVYLGHLEDQLGGTSNAGAVTHATGAKVYAESFGLNADGSSVASLQILVTAQAPALQGATMVAKPSQIKV
ncbi:hypothetical protein ACEYW6_35885 [Nostoc sp. UIC 10607]|uniref:hypothetical protein n=1 Tax=Nostoc sp. UIC 10607 TaxID=3045935 RepID=UPI0039A0F6F7